MQSFVEDINLLRREFLKLYFYRFLCSKLNILCDNRVKTPVTRKTAYSIMNQTLNLEIYMCVSTYEIIFF